MQLHLDGEHFQLDIVIETFPPESHGVTCEGDAVDAPRAHVACEVQRAGALVLVEGEHAGVCGVADGTHLVALKRDQRGHDLEYTPSGHRLLSPHVQHQRLAGVKVIGATRLVSRGTLGR